MHKIKTFFNKKANTKRYIIVGIILIVISLITALIYVRTTAVIYGCISLISFLFLSSLLMIYFIKSFKEEIKYGAYIVFIILDALILMSLLAKGLYKYTNISTAVWLSSISTIMASIISTSIAGCVSYFIVLKQIKFSHKSLEEQIEENKQLTRYTLEEAKNEKDKRNNDAALNYVYLLNTEMTLHREIFITYIYIKSYSSPVPSDLDDIFKSLNSKKWDKIFGECAKCFSNDLMEDLSGYYYGIERIKEVELTDDQMKDIIKDQLISMYKCINIAKSEFSKNLRIQEIYDFDGKKISVDKKTGELIIK